MYSDYCCQDWSVGASTVLNEFFTGEAKYGLDETYEDFKARYHLENMDEE
jgi:hypothetical protein